jgi:hypothetical protein
VVWSLRRPLASLLVGLTIGLLGAGCNTLSPSPTDSPVPTTPDSGVRGRVLLGPTCENPRPPASPCLEPYVARLVIVDARGEPAAEVTSGADGRFEVTLPTGGYTIVPVPGGEPYPNADPIPVAVGEGVYTEVEIRYDSGIRVRRFPNQDRAN